MAKKVKASEARFLLFATWDYYPSGGWNDFVGAFKTQKAAMVAIQTTARQHGDRFHVVSLETLEIVWGGRALEAREWKPKRKPKPAAGRKE
jgi:hypothetical protein